MQIRTIVALLAASPTFAAAGFDQPEVKYHVELKHGSEVAECIVVAASLGERAVATLQNGMKVEAFAMPLDREGVSSVDLGIYSEKGAKLHHFKHPAKLAQSAPSFHYTVKGTPPKIGLAIVVESSALLATTRNSPSWREFDTRMKPNHALERTVVQRGCGGKIQPAAQLGR